MDPKLVKDMIKTHAALEALYLQGAQNACRAEQPYEVWQLMREMFAQQSKARRLDQRYGKVN